MLGNSTYHKDNITTGVGGNKITLDGTGHLVKATCGSSIVDGVNNTFTTGGPSPVTLNGATGPITGKTANIGGVTVDGTNNHVMGLCEQRLDSRCNTSGIWPCCYRRSIAKGF